MHELSLAMSIVQIGVEQAVELGAPIVAIQLRLGALSGVDPEALRAAYDIARENSPLVRAELIIEEVPVVVKCGRCGAETAVEFPRLMCNMCGTPTADVVRGRELEVVGIEVEE